MNPYASGRDGFSRDGPSRPPAHRRRSQSPPPTRLHRDHDGPAKTLPRKPTTAFNSTSLGPADTYIHGHASASSSTSTYDGSATYVRPPTLERSKPIVPRRSSNAVDPRSEVVHRLTGAKPERTLFEQIESKRWAMSEDRKDLSDLLKKIKSLEDYLAKSGNKDTKNIERLTSHKQQQQRLEQKIKVETDELYRMTIEWQYDLTVHFFPALLAAATVPIEANIDDLRSKIKADREDEQKRYDSVETKSRMALGEVNRLKSDINKITQDVSGAIRDGDRLRQDYTEFSKQLRKDVDKDVKQINDNRQRLNQIERNLASLQARGGGANPSLAQQATVATFVRANSNVPSSPGSAQISRPRATSPPQDPRTRPAPRPQVTDAASTSATASTSASAAAKHEPSAENATTAPKPATGSEPVTRAQFRKWARDFHLDLELQLEELKDIAVGEATFENQARMEDRIRALARRWKEKATNGEDLSGRPAAEGSGATATNAVIASIDNLAAVTPQSTADTTTQPTPMDIETNATQERPTNTSTGPNGVQPTQGATASTSKHGPTSPASSEADFDVVEVTTPPNATSQNGTAATSTSAASNTSANADPKTNADATSATQQASSTPADPNAAAVKTVKMPAEILRNIREALKQHESQIVAVKREFETLRTSENRSLDHLLNAPDKLKQLSDALKANGLDIPAESIGALATQLEAVISAMRADIVAIRNSQQNLDDRVTTLETWQAEFIQQVNGQQQWLQKQLETLDDQSSLQGALLVKLAEHANPRRKSAAPATSVIGAIQAAAATNTRSPNVAHAVPPLQQPAQIQAQPMPQLQQQPLPPHPHQAQQHTGNSPNLMMRAAQPQQQQRPGDVAPAAMSAHMHQLLQQRPQQPPQIQPPMQQIVHHQMQQPQQQQQQQHPAYNMPQAQALGQYHYQDPNQRRGYP
ncbi:hypothetical protein NDA16_005166 [Ustilago loliicola]|nr:hypothetical protein NDA16_005166 [Ustilago loliicola]